MIVEPTFTEYLLTGFLPITMYFETKNLLKIQTLWSNYYLSLTYFIDQEI